MRLVKIGVAGVSVKVGDFRGNSQRLEAVIREAAARGCHLLVTPELAVSGYSLEDRVWWPDIARRAWETLERLAEIAPGVAVFAGLPVHHDAMMYNGAALLYNGAVRGLVLKRYLPTYSIFYEGRNWTAWHGGATIINGVPAGDVVFNLPFGKVSAELCEDLWSSRSPGEGRVLAGAEILCNLSASPFTPGKNAQRRRLVLRAAESLACAYAYANLLGLDNSRLVFDGGGFIATPEGVVAEGAILSRERWTLATGIINLDDITRVRAENSTWRDQAIRVQARNNAALVELNEQPFTPASVAEYAAQMPVSFFWPDAESPKPSTQESCLDELFDALVLGLRDYFEKAGAFQRFLVALSGGRDSALCLLLAVEAAKALDGGPGPDGLAGRIASVYLPNRAYSSQATEDAARAVAEELGVPFRVTPIDDEVAVALDQAAALMDGMDHVTPLAKQNMQARVRGNMMLNWANSAGGLLLVTSNLSEAAVGYTTTGGDNQGGYSPIANVPKTLVSRLIEHIAAREGLASLAKVLAIPPSAELAPDQQDETDLMPYVVLDDLMCLFARRRMALSDCWRVLVCRHPAHSPEQLRTWTSRFGRLFAYNQWKREQLPVALKVIALDLDPKTGFRFPVTQSIQDELDELESADRDG